MCQIFDQRRRWLVNDPVIVIFFAGVSIDKRWAAGGVYSGVEKTDDS